MNTNKFSVATLGDQNWFFPNQTKPNQTKPNQTKPNQTKPSIKKLVMPGADVTLKLEIDAEVSSGLDRAKVRTLMENANTLNFTDKSIE